MAFGMDAMSEYQPATRRAPMTVAIVATYPPRPCGIAVFSGDLRNAILGADSSVEVEIVAMVRDGESAGSPHVVHTIRQSVAADYAAAAADLNRRVDVVLIEHEFGIFGGEVGCHVLELMDGLTVPVVVTLHTVLAEPSEAQSRTLRALCEGAARVMVFTETARRMVVSQGLADPDRVRVVPHGAPDVLSEMAWADSVSDQSPPGVLAVGDQVLPISADQTVLSTFGLISGSKGLEVTLRALPAITAAHPDVVYLIAGQTHPDVIDHEGESYRLGLARLVRELGLERPRPLPRPLPHDRGAVAAARPDRHLSHAIPLPGADRLRGADVRGGRGLSGGLNAILLRRGPARIRRRAAGAVRRRAGHGRRGAGPSRLSRVPGGSPGAGSAGGCRTDLVQRGQGNARRARRGGGVASDPLGPIRPSAYPPNPRSGRTICCGSSTTWASCSTRGGCCRIVRPGTASTTWPAW